MGSLVAALGIRMVGHDALVHSETIPDFALADVVRPILWERLRNLAKNLGAARIWTRENAPFWRQVEFDAPDGEQLAKLPPAFRSGDGTLLLLILRQDDAVKRVEQEFEMFRLQEKARVDDLKAQGRIWRWIATIIALALFIFVVVGAVRLFQATRQRRSDAPIRSAPTGPSRADADLGAGVAAPEHFRA